MKLTIIGGAGVRTVIFVNGLLKRYKKLQIDEVVLYDIQPEKLAVIEKLCRHVVQRNGETLTVYAKSNAQEAIEGAAYIVTTLRVGGDHSRVIDETLAMKLGVIGQETTGVGGFSMAVRTIPVLTAYCEMVKKYAPGAWIFNFTNPSGLVTQALKSAGYDKIVGICDAPSSTAYRMAKRLGVAEEELHVEFFGLNHLSWIQSVKIGDTDAPELLTDLINDDAFLNSIQEFSMFDPGVIRTIGLLPNEYLYYYYHREKALENMRKSAALRGKTIEQVNERMSRELSGMDLDKNPEAALQTFLYYMQLRENSYMSVEAGIADRPLLAKGQLPIPDGIGYSGVMLDCIEGLLSDTGKYLVLSVENQGTLSCLADDDVIEATCKVTKQGIFPVSVPVVPADCELLMRVVKRYERLTAAAVNQKSEQLAIQALMHHPLIGSYSLAKKLVKRYGEAYGGLFE